MSTTAGKKKNNHSYDRVMSATDPGPVHWTACFIAEKYTIDGLYK